MTAEFNTYEALVSITGSKRVRLEAESLEAAYDLADRGEWDATRELDHMTHGITVCDVRLVEENPAPTSIASLVALLDHVRATLKLRHIDEATDDEVEEALQMAAVAIARTRGGAQ